MLRQTDCVSCCLDELFVRVVIDLAVLSVYQVKAHDWILIFEQVAKELVDALGICFPVTIASPQGHVPHRAVLVVLFFNRLERATIGNRPCERSV